MELNEITGKITWKLFSRLFLRVILEVNFAADFYKLMDVFFSGEGFIDKSTKSFSLKLKLSSTE